MADAGMRDAYEDLSFLGRGDIDLQNLQGLAGGERNCGA
jgi:hypothetical protein